MFKKTVFNIRIWQGKRYMYRLALLKKKTLKQEFFMHSHFIAVGWQKIFKRFYYLKTSKY